MNGHREDILIIASFHCILCEKLTIHKMDNSIFSTNHSPCAMHLNLNVRKSGLHTNIFLYYYFSFDEKFFTFCDKELTKINTFYAEKLAEATRKFATLKSEMEESEKSSVAKKKVSIVI